MILLLFAPKPNGNESSHISEAGINSNNFNSRIILQPFLGIMLCFIKSLSIETGSM